ncbi:MAG: hypothetical protein GQ565_12455 [Candidatus Aegiribacteria sp.]|nr:hypothetical protein [Candidatus Aegiribacteria sp.]
MRLAAVILITAVLLLLACKADYDIEEVTPPEHTGTDHHDEHDECEHEHPEHVESSHEHETEAAEPASVHEESHEHDVLEMSGSHRHVHAAGEKNHGTGWFFNQPWAASFIWGKMLRDALILLVLSAVILFLSKYRRKRQ